MELLELARGPGLALSVSTFVLGTVWRLYGIFRLPLRTDLSEPRHRGTTLAGLQAIGTRMLPRPGMRVRISAIANAYAYHLALALVVLGFAPHIAFLDHHLGIRWPALPDAVAYVASPVAILGLGFALVLRLGDPVLRMLSGFDDYFSWFVTLLPFLTGMALVPAPAAAGPLAVHLLSLELLLIWMPFGKLSHAFLVFVSRYRTGADFRRRGAAL